MYYYAECRYTECRFAKCRYAECRYAECRNAECHIHLSCVQRVRTFSNMEVCLTLYSLLSNKHEFLKPKIESEISY